MFRQLSIGNSYNNRRTQQYPLIVLIAELYNTQTYILLKTRGNKKKKNKVSSADKQRPKNGDKVEENIDSIDIARKLPRC